jgi:hypothetical protein
MIPRLEAEESIRRSKEIAVGTGALANPRAVSDQWERLARGSAAAAPASRSSGSRKPALFSDEVLARLPVRRVVKRKG